MMKCRMVWQENGMTKDKDDESFQAIFWKQQLQACSDLLASFDNQMGSLPLSPI